MNEHGPQPAEEQKEISWRRLDVVAGRFADRIAAGIAGALADQREIDDSTARMIAHVLGRAYGRDSHLAAFGREGDGDYLDLRDEYLRLYNAEQINSTTIEMIDWLGTYLVQRENTGSDRRFMNELLPPKLDRLLLPTCLRIGDGDYVVHVPASCDSAAIDELSETLRDLRLPEDDALQAFLALPDVSAMSGDIMGSFDEAFAGTYPDRQSVLRALSPLEDWESSLADWCIDQGIDLDTLQWQYESLIERLRESYDLVEKDGQIHAFAR